MFGLGVGWFEEEFEVLNQDFHNEGPHKRSTRTLPGTVGA
ncbi:MAG: hypothetical protein Ct9H300mP14_14250 [Gammaproteobacteria bacterium]|nr:MAG: hypothetical protein Ct9H300mP14_14250 [Gammaproteobacteria bacterium]